MWRASSRAGLVLAAVLLASGCEAADVGEAELRNESGRAELEVVLIDPQGRSSIPFTMEETYHFDTQWLDREVQCLVAEDGHFEVREADGEVLVRHGFADRPVCEHDVIVLGPDGSLTWE